MNDTQELVDLDTLEARLLRALAAKTIDWGDVSPLWKARLLGEDH